MRGAHLILVRVMLVGALAIGLGACDRPPEFSEPVVLGGVSISAEVLNQGLHDYQRFCQACHGPNGDGGPARRGPAPQPRDFTAGLFKFKSTPGDALPTDVDLARTITRGLAGTPMIGFPGLGEQRIEALVHVIKTFSPRWRDEVAPAPLEIPDDPWRDRPLREALTRGEALYHSSAGCLQCHPATLPAADLPSLWQGSPANTVRADVWRARPVETAYGRVLPPDLLSDIPRAGRQARDFYRTVAVGIGGTPMTGLQDRLEAVDLWALAHFLESLGEAGGTARIERPLWDLARGTGE